MRADVDDEEVRPRQRGGEDPRSRVHAASEVAQASGEGQVLLAALEERHASRMYPNLILVYDCFGHLQVVLRPVGIKVDRQWKRDLGTGTICLDVLIAVRI